MGPHGDDDCMIRRSSTLGSQLQAHHKAQAGYWSFQFRWALGLRVERREEEVKRAECEPGARFSKGALRPGNRTDAAETSIQTSAPAPVSTLPLTSSPIALIIAIMAWSARAFPPVRHSCPPRSRGRASAFPMAERARVYSSPRRPVPSPGLFGCFPLLRAGLCGNGPPAEPQAQATP
jgi:hypothetical protein